MCPTIGLIFVFVIQISPKSDRKIVKNKPQAFLTSKHEALTVKVRGAVFKVRGPVSTSFKLGVGGGGKFACFDAAILKHMESELSPLLPQNCGIPSH